MLGEPPPQVGCWLTPLSSLTSRSVWPWSSILDREDVSGRILEPGDPEIARLVDVALAAEPVPILDATYYVALIHPT